MITFTDQFDGSTWDPEWSGLSGTPETGHHIIVDEVSGEVIAEAGTAQEAIDFLRAAHGFINKGGFDIWRFIHLESNYWLGVGLESAEESLRSRGAGEEELQEKLWKVRTSFRQRTVSLCLAVARLAVEQNNLDLMNACLHEAWGLFPYGLYPEEHECCGLTAKQRQQLSEETQVLFDFEQEICGLAKIVEVTQPKPFGTSLGQELAAVGITA